MTHLKERATIGGTLHFFMADKFQFNFEHPHEPMDVINAWQEWSRQHRVVAEIDEPLVTKQAREELHNTSKAVSTWPKGRWTDFFRDIKEASEEPREENKSAAYVKAFDYFADTIAEMADELTPSELYQALLDAVDRQLSWATKEYDYAKDLHDLVTGKTKLNNK